MVLPIKPTKYNNQSYSEFDMEVFEWRENANNFFGRIRNIDEGNKNM